MPDLKNLTYPQRLLVLDVLRSKFDRELTENDLFWRNLKIDPELEMGLQTKLTKLEEGYPLDYLLSEIKFLGLRVKVEPGVFIPRPETEEWVGRLSRSLDDHPKKPLLVDLCAGTGVIGLSLAKFYEEVRLVDFSEVALENILLNTTKNGVQNVQVIQSDLLIDERVRTKILQSENWDLVCNPPYVPDVDRRNLRINKIEYEPPEAIFGGEDGLEIFEKILAQLKSLPLPQNAYFELDPRNINQARGRLSKLFGHTEIWPDGNGLERVLVGF
jgi:release factor glutamine methyltransferase